MTKIKELTAHLRRLIEKNYIVDYGIDNELNTVLNQIDIESELMQPTDNINIKAMAEKEYPITMRMYANDKPPMDINEDARKVYIKGYKQAISTTPTTTWIEIKGEDDLPKDDKNVLAMIDGEMKIMCLSDIIENGVSSKVWCLVYDSLDGDGIYDDNYYPTHWMPLPTHPQTESTKINYINKK